MHEYSRCFSFLHGFVVFLSKVSFVCHLICFIIEKCKFHYNTSYPDVELVAVAGRLNYSDVFHTSLILRSMAALFIKKLELIVFCFIICLLCELRLFFNVVLSSHP